MPAVRRHTFIKLAREKDCLIIEDDYDSEFRFVGKPISTMASLDGERVIYMNTFSRTLSPSIRIAYMVLPDRLMAEYRRRLGFYSCTVSGMEQYTLAKFISDGYYERHLSRMRNAYRSRRDTILSAIRRSKLAGHVTIKEENAGLHFILRINSALDDEAYAAALLSRGIRIAPLSDYCRLPQKAYRHEFIISYSQLDAAALEKALEIMAELITVSQSGYSGNGKDVRREE